MSLACPSMLAIFILHASIKTKISIHAVLFSCVSPVRRPPSTTHTFKRVHVVSPGSFPDPHHHTTSITPPPPSPLKLFFWGGVIWQRINTMPPGTPQRPLQSRDWNEFNLCNSYNVGSDCNAAGAHVSGRSLFAVSSFPTIF